MCSYDFAKKQLSLKKMKVDLLLLYQFISALSELFDAKKLCMFDSIMQQNKDKSSFIHQSELRWPRSWPPRLFYRSASMYPMKIADLRDSITSSGFDDIFRIPTHIQANNTNNKVQWRQRPRDGLDVTLM